MDRYLYNWTLYGIWRRRKCSLAAGRTARASGGIRSWDHWPAGSRPHRCPWRNDRARTRYPDCRDALQAAAGASAWNQGGVRGGRRCHSGCRQHPDGACNNGKAARVTAAGLRPSAIGEVSPAWRTGDSPRPACYSTSAWHWRSNRLRNRLTRRGELSRGPVTRSPSTAPPSRPGSPPVHRRSTPACSAPDRLRCWSRETDSRCRS